MNINMSDDEDEGLKRRSSIEVEIKKKDRCLIITALHAYSPISRNIRDIRSDDYFYEKMRKYIRLISIAPAACSNFFKNISLLQGSRPIQKYNKTSSAQRLVSNKDPENLRESGKLGKIAIQVLNEDKVKWSSDLISEYDPEIARQIPGGKDTRNLMFERMLLPQVLSAEAIPSDEIDFQYKRLLRAAKKKLGELGQLGQVVDDRRNYLTVEELHLLDQNGFNNTRVGSTGIAGQMLNFTGKDQLGYIILSHLIIKLEDQVIIINSIQGRELNIIELSHLKTIYSRLKWTGKDDDFFEDEANKNQIKEDITGLLYEFFWIQEEWNKYCDNGINYKDFYVGIENGIVTLSNTFFNRLIILLIKKFIITTGIKKEVYNPQLDDYKNIIEYSQDIERIYGETVIYDVSNACRNFTSKIDPRNTNTVLSPDRQKLTLRDVDDQNELFERSGSYRYCKDGDCSDQSQGYDKDDREITVGNKRRTSEVTTYNPSGYTKGEAEGEANSSSRPRQGETGDKGETGSQGETGGKKTKRMKKTNRRLNRKTRKGRKRQRQTKKNKRRN